MIDRAFDTAKQQPCIHCGECARACPEALNPDALFFALVQEDFSAARHARLDACSECNRCVESCPSHIPLLDWLRWGKAEVRARARAEGARRRFLARNQRLADVRGVRGAKRRDAAAPAALPAQTISRDDVIAAIARGKARRRAKRP